MRPSPDSGRRPQPLTPLLFRQNTVLAWIAGLLSARYLIPGCTVFLLLLWIDSRCHRLNSALCLGLCFCLGLCVAHATIPERPENPPVWARKTAESGIPRVRAVVATVQGLPGMRYRMLLEHVRPAEAEKTGNTPVPETRLLWTWSEPLRRPLPGQTVEFSLPWKTTAGFRNAGCPDFGMTRENEGLFWQVWSRNTYGNPQIAGPTDAGTELREKWRTALLTALKGKPLFPADNIAAGAEDLNGEQTSSGIAPLTQAQAFIPALLFGDRFFFERETLTMLADAALIHSIALSGQHLAIALLAGLGLVIAAARLLPQLYLRLPRQKLAALCSLPPAFGYLWLGSAPPSLLRAACMMLILSLFLYKNRTCTTLDILSGALLLITAANPHIVFTLSFQLSGLAVAGIGLFMPLIRAGNLAIKKLRLPCPLLWQSCTGTLLCSVAVTLTLLPVTVWYFHNIGLWFPLNLLWLPVLGLIVMPLAFGGLLFAVLGSATASPLPETAASLLLNCAVQPCDLLLRGLAWLNDQGWLSPPPLIQPHWTFWLGFWLLLLTACLRVARKSLPPAARRCLAAAGILFLCAGGRLLITALDEDIHLAVLDVGQGQALVLDLPDGQRLLFDGGGLTPAFDIGRAVVEPRLTVEHRPYITAMIGTHPDMDHIGGLFSPGRRFNVGELWHNGEYPKNDLHDAWLNLLETIPSRRPVAGDRIILDKNRDIVLEVLNPPVPGGSVSFSGNDASLAFRLTRRGKGLALLMGDVGQDALREIVARGTALNAPILIAPHHGSSTGLRKDFYEAAAPELVIASCGRDNRFGHPSPKLRQALDRRHIPLLTTAAVGEITVTFDPSGHWRILRTGASGGKGLRPLTPPGD